MAPGAHLGLVNSLWDSSEGEGMGLEARRGVLTGFASVWCQEFLEFMFMWIPHVPAKKDTLDWETKTTKLSGFSPYRTYQSL